MTEQRKPRPARVFEEPVEGVFSDGTKVTLHKGGHVKLNNRHMLSVKVEERMLTITCRDSGNGRPAVFAVVAPGEVLLIGSGMAVHRHVAPFPELEFGYLCRCGLHHQVSYEAVWAEVERARRKHPKERSVDRSQVAPA